MHSPSSHDLGTLAEREIVGSPIDSAEDAVPPRSSAPTSGSSRSEASFSRRWRVAELMDDPKLDAAAHRQALRGIARLNRLSHSVANVWNPIRRLVRRHGLRRLSVLDVATGGGDIPIAIRRRARRMGLDLTVTGIDVSEQALDIARSNAEAAGESVRFRQADVLAGELPGRYDVVMSSLFMHHLADDEAERLLGAMKRATRRLVVVNDLVRSRLNYLQTWVAVRVMSRSPIVHFDGPASIQAAFTRAEALAVAERAGLAGAVTTSAFPCKFVLTWSPADAS